MPCAQFNPCTYVQMYISISRVFDQVGRSHRQDVDRFTCTCAQPSVFDFDVLESARRLFGATW